MAALLELNKAGDAMAALNTRLRPALVKRNTTFKKIASRPRTPPREIVCRDRMKAL